MSDVELVLVNAHDLAAILEYIEVLLQKEHLSGEIEILALLSRLRARVKFAGQIGGFK